MSLKVLVKHEYDDWKARMQKETCGTYIGIYLGFIFSVFISLIYGFHYEKDAFIMIVTLTFFIGMIYQVGTSYLSYVRENGKRVNVFEKYVYTPVDFNLLRKAKLIVVGRIIGLPVIFGQLASVFICIIDPDQEGGSLSDLNVWMPFITGAVFVIIKFIEYKRLCKQAIRKVI